MKVKVFILILVVALVSSVVTELRGWGGGYGLPEEEAFAEAETERDAAVAAYIVARDNVFDSKTDEERKENRKKREKAKNKWLKAAEKYNKALEAMEKARRKYAAEHFPFLFKRMSKEELDKMFEGLDFEGLDEKAAEEEKKVEEEKIKITREEWEEMLERGGKMWEKLMKEIEEQKPPTIVISEKEWKEMLERGGKMWKKLMKEIEEQRAAKVAEEYKWHIAPGLEKYAQTYKKYKGDLPVIKYFLGKTGINLGNISDITALIDYVNKDTNTTSAQKETFIDYIGDVSVDLPINATIVDVFVEADTVAGQLGEIKRLEDAGILAPVDTGEAGKEMHMMPRKDKAFTPPTKDTSVQPGTGLDATDVDFMY